MGVPRDSAALAHTRAWLAWFACWTEKPRLFFSCRVFLDCILKFVLRADILAAVTAFSSAWAGRVDNIFLFVCLTCSKDGSYSAEPLSPKLLSSQSRCCLTLDARRKTAFRSDRFAELINSHPQRRVFLLFGVYSRLQIWTPDIVPPCYI